MTASNPTDFPVPGDIEFAMWDKHHCPRVMSPMSEDVFGDGVSAGFTRGMEEFACPVGLRYQSVNYYSYAIIEPQEAILSGRETMENRLARYSETLGTTVGGIGRLWREEWLPAILPGIEKTRTQDYAAMSDSELMAAFDEAFERFVERYVVHGKINFILVPASRFADFYKENFNPEDETEPYEALQGFPTMSLEAGRGLWSLARMVRSNPNLMKAFESTETRELEARLEQDADGRAFLAEFRKYLDEFGWRADAFELMDEPWRENPLIPFNALQGYIYLDDEDDPEARFQQAVARREELLANARAKLASDAGKLAEFERLYAEAKDYLNVTEDHNYFIDQVGNTIMRLPLLEMARRLVDRGLIVEQNDVFRLHVSEVRDALLNGKDSKQIAATRRAEMESWAKVVPPPTLGTPPPPNDDPLMDGLFRMFGMPPEPSTDPQVINGIAASPGTVQGPAKVVRTLAEASKLEKGDIMVCEMTMPPWTPLFSTAAAVVAGHRWGAEPLRHRVAGVPDALRRRHADWDCRAQGRHDGHGRRDEGIGAHRQRLTGSGTKRRAAISAAFNHLFTAVERAFTCDRLAWMYEPGIYAGWIRRGSSRRES